MNNYLRDIKINIISNVPYDYHVSYNIPNKIKVNYIKKFKYELTPDLLIDFFNYATRSNVYQMINFIKQVYSESFDNPINLSPDDIRALSKNIYYNDGLIDLVKFVTKTEDNEIFSEETFDIFNSRSFKIYETLYEYE